MVDIDAIKAMLAPGRVNDLLLLMEGDSKYSGPLTENLPRTREQVFARLRALEHVKFVAKYGLEKTVVKEGAMIYESRPDGFEEWLSLGAPGIEPTELDKYLQENPL
jgi:hypothetical protein